MGSEDLASIAHHAHGAGRYDELASAAREGARQYLASGSAYQALELAELGLTEVCDDPALLAFASQAAWLTGLVDEATAHAQRLLEVARRTGDVAEESLALRRLVRLRWEQGDEASTRDVTDRLIELIDQLADTEERGKAMVTVAQSFMLRGLSTEAVEWADRAIALAEEHAWPWLRVWAEVEKGSALTSFPELFEVGDAMLARVAGEAEALGEHVIVARALNNRVRSVHFRPDTREARDLLGRMRRAAERAGFDSLAGPGYWQGLAALAEWEGDLDGAREYLDEGRKRDRGIRQNPNTSWYEVQEAGLALEKGEVARARELLDQLTPAPHARWWLGLSLHLACREGALDEARRCFAKLLESYNDAATSEGQLLHDLVTPMLAAGFSPDEVRPLVEREPEGPWRRFATAQIAEAEGRNDDALAGYLEAVESGEKLFRPSALGTAHVGVARTSILAGDIDLARTHATRAAELLARWDGWRVDELHAVQRRLGVGPGVEGPDALTPREREVVELLAEGLTNAELAARLFISPKTAAVHVSNILAKLGMASRSEVAAFAVREGLATSRQ
jgi:DNA-binding CsgD family transcriptional regulator